MSYRRRQIKIIRLMIGMVAVMLAASPVMAQNNDGSPPAPASLDKFGTKSHTESEKIPISQEMLKALASGNIAFFEPILSSGADPDTILPGKGKTLLMEANSVPLVALLLDSGADPTLRDDEGATALHHAVLHLDAAQIISMLIDKGADVNATDRKGNTPLIAAVVNDKPDLVELLLSFGALVGIKSGDGQTALEWAEELGFVDIIELLEAAKSNQ